ncbi:MAG: class I SAM-dependent methyltransferase [Candidatus Accumulibacter sp.]|uniref:class I SAM-dependent methyltransferase n=1 Tax=Accumulibacter sp. TaxID=2053492 RepID=UPI0019DC9636|nr:class I SAM-dependent methyltransferase [Accumulibacter sp.]MBE2258885.1 class I SAM-dependent methyltransferase [Paracoccaceae bacterium]MCP5249634.1 class I SAM-dependent methyltransferase [Accumulibacter sp.]
MPLRPDELEQIAAQTIEHYNQNAANFRDATRDHDVSQNVAALLRHIEGLAPFTILDFGCGPGRDLKTLAGLGHRAIGLDGARAFVDMARIESGCPVWQQDFLKLDLPGDHFDGVFANASLFHVPQQELPRVLRQLHATLKRRGVLFCSNPRGDNEEGWHGQRYASYHDLAAWRCRMADAGYLELEHYFRPAGLPCAQQPWLASVWRKAAQ